MFQGVPAPPRCDVVIIGAGPYGLAAAAHLQPHDLDVRTFGSPMEYWRRMPAGMLLRSPWHASSISSPGRALSLASYETAIGHGLSRPIPLDDFVAYGRWFAERAAPQLDERRVLTVDLADDGFAVALEDGETLRAGRVVMATGLLAADHVPDVLAGLPAEAAWHTSQVRDPSELAGRRVLIVGGGQSATECAALLREAGADVEIVMRARSVNWLERSGRLHQSALRPLFYPDTDVGPPILNQIVNKPRLFGRFPESLRERMAYRSIRPAAAGWLRPRLTDVTITCGRSVVAASAHGSGASVRLDDGSERRVDHVLAGTGFRLDVARHPLLVDGIRSRVRSRGGYPELGRGCESSVPGLHFLGAMSAKSYGPVMRFVSGTWATGPVLARAIAVAQASARTAVPPPTALRDAEQPSW